MTTQSSIPNQRRGFTLIELLVVIAIIVVLAGLAFGAGALVLEKARRTTALNECTSLVTAVSAYYDEYSQLPEVENGDAPQGVKSDRFLMNPLVALDDEQNAKKIRFFNGREAKGRSVDRAYGGLYYTGDNAELFDSWKKFRGSAANNRHFLVVMDTQYLDEVIDPFSSDQRPLRGKRVIAYSTGKDGQYSLGDERAEENKDNVYSWRN